MRNLEMSFVSFLYAVRDYFDSLGRKQPPLFSTLMQQAIEVAENMKYQMTEYEDRISASQTIIARLEDQVRMLNARLVSINLDLPQIVRFTQAAKNALGPNFAGTEKDTPEVIKEWLTGNKINAIKLLRGMGYKQADGSIGYVGLKETKDFLEQYKF